MAGGEGAWGLALPPAHICASVQAGSSEEPVGTSARPTPPPCRLRPRLPQRRTVSPSRPAAPPGQLTDVFGSDGHRPSQLGDELLGVQADLDDVIQQREQRGQRKRRHEQGDEAELDDCEESGGLSTHRAPPPTGPRRPEPPSRTHQVWWAPSPLCALHTCWGDPGPGGGWKRSPDFAVALTVNS